jgi:hypothetical protein
MTATSILNGWNATMSDRFGKDTILFNHRLRETGLFTEEALADLIERYPAEHYNINTMGFDPANPVWREGEVGDVSGADTIAAIKKGRMWLNMRKVAEVDAEYRKVLNQIFAEFEGVIPGLKTFKHNLGILVSSPKVQVFYHADVPGQSLWQIEGVKRVYIYEPREPFLSKESLEGIIMGLTEEEIPYRKSFDDEAAVVDLEPGQALTWPLNGPHRIENHDCLNISVTTEHWTNTIRNSYAVNYANGILRRKFGMTGMNAEPSGMHVYPKAAMTLAWKKLNLGRAEKFVRKVDFRVNPESPAGIVDIPAYVK